MNSAARYFLENKSPPLYLEDMNQEHVDILLASYNGEAHIGEQIDSILNQTHKQWRLFIGDDASDDLTPSIAEGYACLYPRSIFFAPFQGRAGVVSNFSRLADLSEAPYTMFADQDDLWFPNKVEATLKKMKELEALHGQETPLLVFTDAVVVNDKLKVISPSYWDYTVMDPARRKVAQLLTQCIVIGCTAMINRPLRELAFPIPPEANMHDYWLGLLAGAFGVIAPLEEQTLFYRHHENNFIGAVKKGPLKGLCRMMRDRTIARGQNRVLVSKMITAYMIYHRYENLMDEETKKIFRAFIEMKNGSVARELLIRLRYGFLRGGIGLNLHDFAVAALMGPLPKKHQLRI